MQVKSTGLIEKAAKLGDGEVEFIVSTGALDAHGERINVDGIDLSAYKKNPIVLWAHDGFNLPIAKTTKIWKEGGKLMARAKFYLKDEFPAKVYQYILDDMLKAVSIGGSNVEWGSDGLTIDKMTMREFSVVPVPANQDAVVTAKTLLTGKVDEPGLNELAKAYAFKCLSDDNELVKSIEVLESLVATLKEVAKGEPHEDTAINRRVVLRQAQAVDHQAETIIRSIKVTRKTI